MLLKKCLKLFLLLGIIVLLGAEVNAKGELKDFTSKPEPAFKWSVNEQNETSQSSTYKLSVTSQTFDGTEWKHSVVVVVPKDIKIKNTAILFNSQSGLTESSLEKESSSYIDTVASMAGCILVALWDVPNEKPDISADGGIAASLGEAIKTEDYTKIVNLAMAKSVIKTMDAVDEFMISIEKEKISKYVITGGSKNGWTSWLAAATGDKRIVGIAPILFDFIDMNRQLEQQKNYYGDYSSRISDYTSRGIQDFSKTPKGKKVIDIVDPITYADEITVPKLIINATNDSFWTFDSANIYWDKLKGDKYLLYLPNMDHGTGRNGADIKPMDLLPVISTLINFTKKCVGEGSMGNIKWDWKEDSKSNKVICNAVSLDDSVSIVSIRAFVAKSENKDFRKIEFTPKAGSQNEDKSFSVEIEKLKDDYQAAVVQIMLKKDGNMFPVYTTPMIINRL